MSTGRARDHVGRGWRGVGGSDRRFGGEGSVRGRGLRRSFESRQNARRVLVSRRVPDWFVQSCVLFWGSTPVHRPKDRRLAVVRGRDGSRGGHGIDPFR